MKKMKKMTLTKENDPRCIEFYNKAFSNLLPEKREEMRIHFITKVLKKIK